MRNERENGNKGKVIEMSDKINRTRLKIGGILAVLFMLIYIPSLVNWLSKDNISSDILRIGVIEESINVEALLIRDEEVLAPSSKDGQIIPEVDEGERIPAFATVATISDKTAKSLLEKLEKVNGDIIQAQNERALKTDFFSEDMAKLDGSISLKVQDIVWASRNNSLMNLGRLKGDVDELMEKKAAIAGEKAGDSAINVLKQKKEQLQEQIRANTSQVTSKYSGIISYAIDGYEKVLAPKSVKNLTPDIIGNIKVNKDKIKKEYGSIEAGKPFAKIIKGYTTILAMILDQKKAEEYKEGIQISIRINDIGQVIPATVKGVYPTSNGKAIIAVSIDRDSQELSAYRKVNADLIKKSKEGLKIPVRCLYAQENKWEKAKVMMIKANCATERQVLVECKDDEYAIIKSPEDEVKKTVSLYDTYILNPENVEEGQIILK